MALVTPTITFTIEGEDTPDGKFVVANCEDPNLLLGIFDIKDNDAKFYKEHIYSKDHANFLCKDSDIGPIAVSLLYENKSYTALLRTPEFNRRVFVKEEEIPRNWWREWLNLPPSFSEVLRSVSAHLPVDKMVQVHDPKVAQALLSIEEQQLIKGFKFGLLYAKEGQSKEDEMFSNIESSPAFEEFLDFLGTRVVLENFTGFRGGLDVKTKTTGSHSIYRVFNNNEIMFHVSTLLPFNPLDKQQLERKRHIGNDIVVIMFVEGDTVYKPTTISSRQVHVIVVVKPILIEGERFYRVAVVSKEGVPEFGPTMPSNAIFRKDENFLRFLYAKLLNAERACYTAPILSNKLSRTRTAMLKDIAQNYIK